MDPNLFQQSDAIVVRRVRNRGQGGRGVFARRAIAAGELVERVPVLLIPKAEVFGGGPLVDRSVSVSWYVFNWMTADGDHVALSLGYGSIYNHSETPNARYEMEPPDVMSFLALRPIRAGEEITISYHGEERRRGDLGFDVSNDRAKPLARRGRT